MSNQEKRPGWQAEALKDSRSTKTDEPKSILSPVALKAPFFEAAGAQRPPQGENVHAALRDMNAKHAVISDHRGRCVVLCESEDGRSIQSFADFRNRYSNRKIEIGRTGDGAPLYTSLGKWWLVHPERRQYESLDSVPGHDTVWRT